MRPHFWACMGICKILLLFIFLVFETIYRIQNIEFILWLVYWLTLFYLQQILYVLLSYFSQLTPPPSPVFTRSQPKYVHVVVHLCTSCTHYVDAKYGVDSWDSVALWYKLAKREKFQLFGACREEYCSLAYIVPTLASKRSCTILLVILLYLYSLHRS